MLKTCKYCGRVHNDKFICEQKEIALKNRQLRRWRKKDNEINRFRGSTNWKNKRAEIRERDKQVCQVCIRGLYKPIRQYETEGLSVHHIKPLAVDWDGRLDRDNLITLCEKHHEMAEVGEIPTEELIRIVREQEDEYK